MKFLALAGAAAAAHTIKTDMLTYAKAPKFMQSLLASVMQGANADPGVPSFSQCDDDLGAFTFDGDSTSVSPNPIVKGTTINFDLMGGFSDSVTVDNLHVHVDWNGSPLYDEDDADGTTYDADYEFQMSWDVPSYAPDGDYKIKLTGTSGDQTVICINAGFTF